MCGNWRFCNLYLEALDAAARCIRHLRFSSSLLHVQARPVGGFAVQGRHVYLVLGKHAARRVAKSVDFSLALQRVLALLATTLATAPLRIGLQRPTPGVVGTIGVWD